MILGTMTWGPSAQVGYEGAAKQVETFVAREIAMRGPNAKARIDTARVYQYGETETLIGDILASRPELDAKVEIHSKANPMMGKLTREGVRSQLEASLKALRRPKLEVFYLHSPDIKTPLVETLQACDELHREGLFDELGLSNYAAWDVAHAHYLCRLHDLKIRPTIYQGLYNALNRSPEAELFPCLRTFQMRFVAYNPLGAGVLTGRYLSKNDLLGADRGRFSPQFDFIPKSVPSHPLKGVGSKLYAARYAKDEYFEAVREIESAIARENAISATTATTPKQKKLTTVEATLRWTMNHSWMRPKLGDAIVFGASSQAQLEENLAIDLLSPLGTASGVVKAYDVAYQPHTDLYFRGYDPKPGFSYEYLSRF